MKVFQTISDALKLEDVEVVFSLMGDANQDLLVDLAERHGLRIIKFRHEQNAVAAADGYARFSNDKIGVAVVTMGPGLTNTATSLVAARVHRSALLVLAGAASVGELRNPQRFDQTNFSTLMAGAGTTLEAPSSLAMQLDQALGHIRRGSGPYVLSLPSNVQRAKALGAPYRPSYGAYQATLPMESLLEQAAQLLARARRPAILAGRGALRAKASQVIWSLADHLKAPIATSLPAKGLCSEHPLWAGVSGGLGEGVALPTVEECDVLLVVGASLNQWTTHQNDLLRGKTVIQVDASAESFGVYAPAHLTLQGDARETLLALLRILEARAEPHATELTWCADLPARWARHAAPIAYETGTDGSIDPRQVVRELDRLLPRDRLVVLGGGHAAFQVCHFLKIRTPDDWNYTIDFGAIGQAMATAIGASFARPGRRLYHLTADGEFMMSLADFHTAVAYKLPMTVIVLNDQGFGQERHDLDHKKLPNRYALQPSPDLAALARACGGRGERFDTPESLSGLETALRVADNFEGPTLFDVRINGAYESAVSQEIAKALA